MAGTFLQSDFNQVLRLSRRVRKLGALDQRRALGAIGAELESQTRARFETETDPDGKRWRPLTAATLLRKLGGARRAYKKRGGLTKRAKTALPRLRILQDEGYLTDSIQSHVHPGHVETGSNLVYAAIHQHGGAEAGMPEIPQRAYLGISPQNGADLVALVDEFLADLVASA